MADRQSPTPAEITIMAAGAVMLVFSFLHFAADRSAWGSHLFPVATLLPLYGLVMGLQIALTKFAGVTLPESVLGFTWEQVHLALGLMAGLMALGWLLTDYGNKQIGMWFEILGGIALVVGAVMLQRERNTGAIG
jgi:predicted MFS family arabinose efflux permease